MKYLIRPFSFNNFKPILMKVSINLPKQNGQIIQVAIRHNRMKCVHEI